MASLVQWIKCQGEVWCQMNSVDLNHSHFNNRGGVYVIWHGGETPETVYVGQTNSLRDRLATHRMDDSIQRYQHLGLFVTWASVHPVDRDGIERYLFDTMRPKVSDRRPSALPIPVQLPR